MLKTRIKVVETHEGTKYYPQRRFMFIWWNIYNEFDDHSLPDEGGGWKAFPRRTIEEAKNDIIKRLQRDQTFKNVSIEEFPKR